MALGVGSEWVPCLERARQREGFTLSRVRSHVSEDLKKRVGWAKIAQTTFVSALATELGTDAATTIHLYVDVVRKRLPENLKELICWSLNLGMPSGYENVQLGERHLEISRKLGVGSPASFRANNEQEALLAFARALDNPQIDDLVALGVSAEKARRLIPLEKRLEASGKGKVTVVGAAVMDLNFIVPHMPEAGQSVQALSFDTSPGGKGLTQAVACARLGLETTLISVVGDDDNGKRILEYLEKQGVSIALVEKRPNSKTAVTGVFTRRVGESSAIGWKNSERLHFSSDLLEDPHLREQIEHSDFVLCSFELPEPVVSKALALAKGGRATTIVTPAPPFHDILISSEVKSSIDYIVANVWELNCLSSSIVRQDQSGAPMKIEAMAEELMIRDQVRNVIVTHNAECHAFLQAPPKGSQSNYVIVAGPSTISESAGERDAFCAMLARRLFADEGTEVSVLDAIKWATGAMGCVPTGTSVPASMPTNDQAEKMFAKQTVRDGLGNLLDSKETDDE